jgi:hypothetical protein
MKTYLLTWNPKKKEADWSAVIARLEAGIPVVSRWSCGNNQSIHKEARVFLLRQGPDNPGIVGSGSVTKGSHPDKHWDLVKRRQGRKAWFLKVKWDSMLPSEKCLSRAALVKAKGTLLSKGLLNAAASGLVVDPLFADPLEKRWDSFLRISYFSPVIGPLGVSGWEGERVEYRAYRRKRDRKLLEAARHAAKGICAVCQVDYSKILQGNGVRVLQVHHKQQLGQLQTPRLNSSEDLAVVCANCHALIHANPRKAVAVEVLNSMLHNQR